MQDKVSILIPAYNAEGFLKRCIDSVLNQTYRDFEVIIVNDGSSDDTQAVCENYSSKDARVSLINQENQGVAAARNRALDSATGDFILFVDADDWIESDMLEKMLNAVNFKEQSDIAFCRHDFANSSQEVDRSGDTLQIEIWDQERQQLEFMKHDRMTGMLWNKLIRKSLFDGIRFDSTVGYGEDAQVLWKVLKNSSSMAVLDQTLYHHVLEKQSISHQSYSSKKFSSIKMWKEIEEDIFKNYPQWKYLVQERQLANATWLCYEMRISGNKNKEEKAAMRDVVRHNISAVFKNNNISLKMKIYAIAVAIGF